MGGRDELVAALERAGLTVVGDGQTEEVPPPGIGWRHVLADGAGDRSVALERPVGEATAGAASADATWHRLASGAGVLAADDVFLVHVVHAAPTGLARWARVRLRLGDRGDLASLPAPAPEGREERPWFLASSLDGDVLIGALSGERALRFVVVDRFRERREEAARKAADETPSQREAAWASLLRDAAPTEELLRSWADGLALNPATPGELWPRLLEKSWYAMYKALPEDVVDVLLAHPDWKVRSGAAERQPNVTAPQWDRVIRAERDERRRRLLAMTAADRWAELDPGTYELLASDPSSRVRCEVARMTALPADVAVALAGDPEDSVRGLACASAWPHLDADAREALLTDPHDGVRAAALLLHHRDHPMPRALYTSLNDKSRVLETCRLEHELAEEVARHGEYGERRALAGNPRLAPDMVALLGEDPDPHIRFTVSIRSDLTEEQRAAIRIDFDPGTRHCVLDWVVALHDDEDAVRRLAASSHPLVRRSVARARRLPPDVVERLARDEDRVVQLFLAESCDDAPAEMLLRVWRWWTGSLSTPDRPRGHPHFPREGLLRYADDPDPRMRSLALDDPASTPELVERQSRDAHEEVRYRAARDPRLSSLAATRLLDDPHDHIRDAAARHPRLPVRVLVGLLRGGGPETAARNPGLPVEVVRRMVDLIDPVAGQTR
ncbi:PE-PGRS family protein [Streptomyces sp. NPDC090106]|uniref:PE-PGRS family protein n=1 Tax=Streptomyces sp. NPDC090106 TaxID=3365946 RepID=UPI0037FB1A4C